MANKFFGMQILCGGLVGYPKPAVGTGMCISDELGDWAPNKGKMSLLTSSDKRKGREYIMNLCYQPVDVTNI